MARAFAACQSVIGESVISRQQNPLRRLVSIRILSRHETSLGSSFHPPI
jgi:hypothetical protein